MAFSAYKQQTDAEELGLTVASNNFIPVDVLLSIEPSDWLKTSLAVGNPYGKVSEKAKSEFMIAPVLLETILRNREDFTVLSGVNLEVNKGENGKKLKGAVDFLLCRGKELFGIKSPIAVLVESKKSDLELGYWQCAAEMYAAKLFNQEKGTPTEKVWGCVSVGFDWQFLQLDGSQLFIERNIYTLNELPKLLGVWQWILDQCKKN